MRQPTDITSTLHILEHTQQKHRHLCLRQDKPQQLSKSKSTQVSPLETLAKQMFKA